MKQFVILFFAACAAFGCARTSSSVGAETPVTIGHVIVGDTSATSTKINVEAEEGREVEARLVGPYGGEHFVAMTPDGKANAVLHVEDLQPNTRYRLMIGGEERASVRTLPEKGERPLRFAFLSCFKASQQTARVFVGGERVEIPNHQMWQVLAQEDLDGLFIIGDRFYLPNPYEYYDDLTEDDARALFAEYHDEMMRIPHVADVLSTTPTYVIWDDHDFGPNDSARNFRFKNIALEALKKTYANPRMGEHKNPGCYFAKSFGPGVDAFFLDDRTYRDCANRMIERRDGSQALLCRPEAERLDDGTYRAVPELDQCFGPEQIAWLKRGLTESRAPIKLVIGGGQFLSNIHPWEAWYQFRERDEFLDWLGTSGVSGVVFVSGDRHHGEIGRLPGRGAYPLYEITSSGMGVSTFGSDDDTPESPYEVLKPVASSQHYGLLEIDGDGIEMVLKGLEGEVTRRRVNVAELQP